MMVFVLRYLIAVSLALLFVANTILTPGAHSQQAEVTNPELAAYIAAGGSWADLCADGDGPHTHQDCPYCREKEIAVLPEFAEPSMQAMALQADLLIAPSSVSCTQQTKTNHPARAPPQLA